jgi:hypothetical protein
LQSDPLITGYKSQDVSDYSSFHDAHLGQKHKKKKAPKVIGEYKLGKELGKGTFGQVRLG